MTFFVFICVRMQFMSDIITKFSDYMYHLIQKKPEKARKRLIQIFRGFDFYQKHFPDQKLPQSKQYLADICMDFMLKSFVHPENAAMTSIFMPCELLQAFDIPTMCAEMFSTYMNGAYSERAFIEAAENAGISETYCSYHKVVMGGAITGVLPPTKLIVNTSMVCDANNLTFRALSHYGGAPQYYVDVPYEQSEESVQYVMKQLKELTIALQELTKRKLDADRLKMIVSRSAETTENLRKTIPYRRERYLGTTLTSELYETLMVHNALGTEEALRYSQMLLKDYQNAPENDGLRILWMHSNPFWQKCVKDLLNENPDRRIVATELGYDNWYEYDPSDPYHYMAERLVYNPYNGPCDVRIHAAREMAEKTNADGIVCFCHWGCKETCGASVRIKRELEEAGYPVLILNGDGVDRSNGSDGQTSTRLGAFLEMLEEKRG